MEFVDRVLNLSPAAAKTRLFFNASCLFLYQNNAIPRRILPPAVNAKTLEPDTPEYGKD